MDVKTDLQTEGKALDSLQTHENVTFMIIILD